MENRNELYIPETFYDDYHSSEVTESYRIINTPSEFAKANLFYTQEAGFLKSLKSHISQREQLNSYLFLIVISGSGHFTYKGVIHKLREGNCILINCNYQYSHQSNENDQWTLMWLHFNGKNVEPYITHYEISNTDVIFKTDIKTTYTTIIKSCLELMNTNNIQTEFLLSKMITDLLTLCITQNKNIPNQKHMEKITLVKEYIDNNFESKISLSGISQEFYTSKYYLAREFKKYYCMTIGDYVSGKRITFAKELLRFTNKTIEEISALCGIEDTNYFAKVFRKLEGCSPSDYKKRW